MIFDTHAHYDDARFDEDRDALLSAMAENGVGNIVNVSACLADCDKGLALADQYDFIYASVGVHPDEVEELNDESIEWMKSRLAHPKVVAVGEIGLDYYREDSVDHDLQKLWMARQMDMAREAGLPVIYHSREAAADTVAMICEHDGAQMGGVMHCYAYSVEMAREYVDMGLYIGVGGVVTFKNGRRLKEVVSDIPLRSIVIETDSPYLAPTPHRGERNDSRHLHEVVAEIANLKGVSREEVIAVTEENARRLYHL